LICIKPKKRSVELVVLLLLSYLAPLWFRLLRDFEPEF